MKKAIMIPMQPQNTINTLNGKRILDLRLWIPKGYVGWVYVYVTKGKPYLVDFREESMMEQKYELFHNKKNVLGILKNKVVNGLVVFRFWFDDYIAYKYYEDNNTYFAKRPQDFGYNADEVLKRLCLSRDEFKAYGKGKDLYVWHIKKLEVFDEPKQLSEFKVAPDLSWAEALEVTKAPKKMVWVYVEDKE